MAKEDIKALVISDFDSRLVWCKGLALPLQEKSLVMHLALSSAGDSYANLEQYFSFQYLYNTLDELVNIIFTGEYNVVFIALGGAQNLKVITKIRQFVSEKMTKQRPIIVTGFNGIEDIADPHGLFCRTGSDFIFVNSPLIYEANKHYLQCLGLNSEPLRLVGYIRDYWHIPVEQTNKQIKQILFALQPGLLDHPKQLEHMGEKILAYCHKFPERQFIIKARGNKKGLHVNLSIEKKYFMPFWKKLVQNGPSNLHLSYEDISELLSKTDLVVSFTSTVLIEGLILGKKVASISDFGVCRSIGNVYLLKSDILCSFNDLLNDNIPEVNKNWEKQNILFSKNKLHQVYDEIKQKIVQQQRSNDILPFETMAYNEENNPYLFRTLQPSDKNRVKRVFLNIIKKFTSS